MDRATATRPLAGRLAAVAWAALIGLAMAAFFSRPLPSSPRLPAHAGRANGGAASGTGVWALWLLGQGGLAALVADAAMLRRGMGLPPPAFWAALAVVVAALALQALTCWQRGPLAPALVQLCSLQAILSLLVVWAAPHGLYGGDAHFDYYLALRVRDEGYPVPLEGLLLRTQGYSHWPLLHILTAAVAEATGADPLQVARHLPVALTASTPALAFFASSWALRRQGPALLGAVLLTVAPWGLVAHSQFIRETIAFPMWLATAALLARGSWPMAALTTLASLPAHHLTSLLALSLWAVALGARLVTRRDLRETLPYAAATALLAAAEGAYVALAPYYAREAVLGSLRQVGQGLEAVLRWDISSPYTSIPRSEDALRLFATYGKQAAGGMMAGVAALWCLARGLKGRLTAGIAFMAALGLGIEGWEFISHYVGAFSGSLNPARLAPFGLWALSALFAAAVGAARRWPRWGAALVAAALAAAFLVELPSDIYREDREPHYEWGHVRWGQTPQLYAAGSWQATHVPAGLRLAGDASTLEVMGGLHQRVIAMDADFFRSGGSSSRWDGFVLRAEMRRLAYFSWTAQGGYRFFPLDGPLWQALREDARFNLVYDNGDVQISLRRRG